MSSRPTSMPSMGLSEMNMAWSLTMRTWIDDEKLELPLSEMLPPVCRVCQSPSVAITAARGSLATVPVWPPVPLSGRVVVAAFLAVPQAVMSTARVMMMRCEMLFFIISLVFYFALQQFVVGVLLEGLVPLLDGRLALVVEPQDVAIVLEQVVVLVFLDGADNIDERLVYSFLAK